MSQLSLGINVILLFNVIDSSWTMTTTFFLSLFLWITVYKRTTIKPSNKNSIKSKNQSLLLPFPFIPGGGKKMVLSHYLIVFVTNVLGGHDVKATPFISDRFFFLNLLLWPSLPFLFWDSDYFFFFCQEVRDIGGNIIKTEQFCAMIVLWLREWWKYKFWWNWLSNDLQEECQLPFCSSLVSPRPQHRVKTPLKGIKEALLILCYGEAEKREDL